MSADLINAVFELLGGFFILNHCWVLYKHKKVSGVSIASTIFFNVWGFWNLYYYPSLNQTLSFWGTILIVFANTLYVGMLIYYSKYYKTKRKYTFETFEELCEAHGMNYEYDIDLEKHIINCINEESFAFEDFNSEQLSFLKGEDEESIEDRQKWVKK